MVLSRPETGRVLWQELPGPALLQGLPPQPGHGPPRAAQVKLGTLCNLVRPSAAKLVGLGVVQTPQTFSVSPFAPTCRTQTYSSSEESYTSTARREGTGEGALSSDSGEAAGQPKEVTSGGAGAEDKNLSEIWEQSMCPSPAEKRAPLLCYTRCLTVPGDYDSGFLVLVTSPSARLSFPQVQGCMLSPGAGQKSRLSGRFCWRRVWRTSLMRRGREDCAGSAWRKGGSGVNSLKGGWSLLGISYITSDRA